MKDQVQINAKEVLLKEAEALRKAAENLGDDWSAIIDVVAASKGRLIVTGIGKSAAIAKKIVATLNSTGTPSIFMHAAEAIHGDLGVLLSDDVLLCISNSGNSPEIKQLLPFIKTRGNTIIAMVGNLNSELANQADLRINASVEQEVNEEIKAPTSSTTLQLALGDALAVCLWQNKGFTKEDFAKSHPGGTLGKTMALTIAQVANQNERPSVRKDSTVRELIYEISSKRLGATAVLDGEKLIGIITDGDIRRMIEKGADLATLHAEDVMTASPKTIAFDALAVDAAKLMREFSITHVIVENEGQYAGMVHLHDLIKEGLA